MTAEKKKSLRRFLMVFGVLAVLAGVGISYLFSGRYMSTDNSYVKANKIMVAPEVSGAVVDVAAEDHQHVKKGDKLFEIDPASYRIALEKAESNLGVVRTQIEELKASARQKKEELKSAEADKDLAETLYRRRTGPHMREAVSQESVDEAVHARDVADSKIAQTQQEYNALLARLGGTADIAPEDHPMFKAAEAARDEAKLNLDRTVVRAPADGITGDMPRPGAYLPAGVPAVGLIASGEVWVEANYKETDLENIHPGEKAEIEVDAYPGRKWQGTVTSIAPATGAEFSVLPAQNATGNWVKVVQRIAVRIEPDMQAGDPPLQTGMSAEVTIDTGSFPHMSGKHGIAGTAVAARLQGTQPAAGEAAATEPAKESQ